MHIHFMQLKKKNPKNIATLQHRWSCKCLSSEGAGRKLPHRKLWCSCKWRTPGRSCQSPSSHSGCSPHWQANGHKTRSRAMTQLWQNWASRRHDNLRTFVTESHNARVTTLTCFSAALQNWLRSIRSPETTDRSSSGDSDRKKKERAHGVNTSLKEEVEVTWRHPGESAFLTVRTETEEVFLCN